VPDGVVDKAAEDNVLQGWKIGFGCGTDMVTHSLVGMNGKVGYLWLCLCCVKLLDDEELIP
jgi:hypothetical protein